MTEAGDGGLGAVLLRERALLLRLLRGRGVAGEEAEDIVQELWLKLQSVSSGPVRDPVAYLCRMAMNLAADRRLAMARALARGTTWHTMRDSAEDIPSPERITASQQELANVQALLAQMPERMAQALRMFRIEEMGQRQIAEQMGVSVSAVEKLLRRAYARLAQYSDLTGAESAPENRLENRMDAQ